MKKQIYFLVEAGYNPNGAIWYDLVKAIDWNNAQQIIESSSGCIKGYRSVEMELSTSFRESIGQLVFDMGYPLYSIKPIAQKYPNS